eukprot:31891_6
MRKAKPKAKIYGIYTTSVFASAASGAATAFGAGLRRPVMSFGEKERAVTFFFG